MMMNHLYNLGGSICSILWGTIFPIILNKPLLRLDHDMWVHLRAYPCPDKCSGIHRSEYEMIDDQKKTAPVCMNGSGFWWFLAGKWSKLLKPYESKRAQKNPLKSQPSTVWQQAAIRWKRLPQNRGGAWPRSDFSIGWLVHPRNYAT